MINRKSLLMCIVIAYLMLMFYVTYNMMEMSNNRIENNNKLIEELRIRKEHHIAVSEDNNRLLHEIQDTTERCCGGKENGKAEDAYQAEEGD